MTACPLTGVGVLVTRPEHQSAEHLAAIAVAGGQAIGFPVIDIIPRDKGQVEADRLSLPNPDIVIFVSANAVEHGMRWIDYENAKIAAIGPATSARLQAGGIKVDICPAGGADSEHLLAEDEFADVSGKVIVIVRGESGRETLAETLSERGARVGYLSVYESCAHAPSIDAMNSLEGQWRDGRINAVMVMSVASLLNMLEILPPYCREQLQKTRLVAPSARVIQTALERIPGVTGILSAGPGAEAMTGALIASLQDNSDTNNG
jgi:uroporphyrinogen-III synthase